MSSLGWNPSFLLTEWVVGWRSHFKENHGGGASLLHSSSLPWILLETVIDIVRFIRRIVFLVLEGRHDGMPCPPPTISFPTG